ncbi:MAG: FAD-dependent oxidoreductase [Clostridium sp.]|nr:FAD-dependent oxidoreductase [Clostridium sp.]MCM1397970.1 FAD-dependent oxidoreductase [Clostridium sp.]MCM1459394.1 FAD-dependent oxidoreductase [Bacteroides sp.]
MYDVVIIGSGPAGLSAAVYAMRAKLDIVVIEKEAFSGGQMISADRVDNYLGLPQKSGYDLAYAFREHTDHLGVSFVSGEASSLEDFGTYKTVTLTNGDKYETKTVLITSGARHKRLNAKGEDRLIGMGVSYCATCDGAFYKGKSVACVGGGNTACHEALYLSNLCDTVYLIHRRKELRASKDIQGKVMNKANIKFMPYFEVKEIYGENYVEEILAVNNRTGESVKISVAGVFVAVGMEPEAKLVKNLAEVDDFGYIVADESCRTSADGIFAAGDVRTKAVRQIITAVSDGANAVYSIEEYLNQRLSN